MKNIVKIVVLVLFLQLLQGCNEKEFLMEGPKDETYADNLFLNYDGFTLAKNALLAFPRKERSEVILNGEVGQIWKIGTDVAWAITELSTSRGLNQYTTVDLTPTMTVLNGDNSNPGIFLVLYQSIVSANTIIERAANPAVNWQGSTPAISESRKNEIIGHARLIRAWAYRHLVMTFGPVPLNVTEINGQNYREDWRRDPVESIQKQIEEDLLFAESSLPDNAKDVTRLSKVIAQYYLADLYLWQGKNAEAEQKTRAIATNTNFALITNRYGIESTLPGCAFMDQFKNGNILQAQGNTEALWVFPNTSVDLAIGQYPNAMRRGWIPTYYNKNIAYLPEYGGRGIGRCGITAWALSIYEPKDHRYSSYALRRSYVDKTGATLKCDSTASKMVTNANLWVCTRKWDWTFADAARWGDSYAYGDQAYLRLSDVYLLLAEALFKQGKSSEVDGAAYWINKVRVRSNATPITAATVTLDYILDERARELITEENRRETLYRTGKLLERTRLYNPIANGTRNVVAGMQTFQILLPIPQRIIDANSGYKMEQNPGY